MEYEAKLDKRIQKTIKAIREAFSELLMEMPYRDISVVTLCDRALVNKKTFYRYYPNTFALLVDLQHEFAVPYVEATKGLFYPDDLEQIVRVFFEYGAEQGPLYDRIVCNENYAGILQAIVQDMEEERRLDSRAPSDWSAEEWSLYIEFVTGTQVLLYRRWVEDGRKVPIEDLVRIAHDLICNGGLAPFGND